MPVVTKHSLQYMLENYRKEHDIENDVLVVILMNTTFAFDPVNHSVYADISADEIATGNGYTQKDKTLTTVTATKDSANSKVVVTADDANWTASGGPWPDIGAACIINTTHVNETIVLCIDFGTDYSIADGEPFGLDFSNGVTESQIIT